MSSRFLFASRFDGVSGSAIREIFNIKKTRHKPHNMGLIAGMSDRHKRIYGNMYNFGGRRW